LSRDAPPKDQNKKIINRVHRHWDEKVSCPEQQKTAINADQKTDHHVKTGDRVNQSEQKGRHENSPDNGLPSGHAQAGEPNGHSGLNETAEKKLFTDAREQGNQKKLEQRTVPDEIAVKRAEKTADEFHVFPAKAVDSPTEEKRRQRRNGSEQEICLAPTDLVGEGKIEPPRNQKRQQGESPLHLDGGEHQKCSGRKPGTAKIVIGFGHRVVVWRGSGIIPKL